MKTRSLLLVCSGNTCRSPMARVLFEHLWRAANSGWDLVVESAGTRAFPGQPASTHAVTAMTERGLDLSGHRSRSVPAPAAYDLILAMTRSHKEAVLARQPALTGRVFTVGEYAGTGEEVPDPFGGPLAAYQQTAVALERLLQAVVQRISTEGSTAQ